MHALSSCLLAVCFLHLSERRRALAVVPKHQLVVYRGAGLAQRHLWSRRCRRLANRVHWGVSEWGRGCQGAQVIQIGVPHRTRSVGVVSAIVKTGGWCPAAATGYNAPGNANRGPMAGVRWSHYISVGGDGGGVRPFLWVKPVWGWTGSGDWRGGVYRRPRWWTGQHHAV